MKIIKKFTAIQVYSERVNEEHRVKLSYGNETGPYYSITHPEKEFDTEDEALEYAYKKDRYTDWLILPLISFDNF